MIHVLLCKLKAPHARPWICSEHAREWVTPLVTIETAERLLRNYAHDGETKKLVDNLDIFLVPSTNPDGANYSFYDYNMQQKNMTNYCGPTESVPGYRTSWGVDLKPKPFSRLCI
ncbi:hypothetical protein H5P36_19445 [Bacillus sp. APMAM]|nr:hypothetical protein [Bacillus sp. APMAM]RTZ54297.1 hypothetical protein EKO25_18900 [Bacillus sp. SAJ1]